MSFDEISGCCYQMLLAIYDYSLHYFHQNFGAKILC
uniref:Uncharacterized protein n=1 Tax=Rhizophora mucronata TaxID=61149 RepID=A0A2P2PBG2_RHIMU